MDLEGTSNISRSQEQYDDAATGRLCCHGTRVRTHLLRLSCPSVPSACLAPVLTFPAPGPGSGLCSWPGQDGPIVPHCPPSCVFGEGMTVHGGAQLHDVIGHRRHSSASFVGVILAAPDGKRPSRWLCLTGSLASQRPHLRVATPSSLSHSKPASVADLCRMTPMDPAVCFMPPRQVSWAHSQNDGSRRPH